MCVMLCGCPQVLAKLDLCSLVPEAGKGLTEPANKEMLQAAAVPCPPSSSRRSGLAAHAGGSSVGARLYCRPQSAAHTPDGDAAVCSAEAGAGGRAVSMRAAAGTVGQYQPCAAHVECVQSVTDARITSMTGMFCHKGGFCDTCPFCQDDKADAIDGTCPTAFCPLSGGLPECINGSMLASYVNANVTNGTICRSTASFSVWNFHGKGAAVAVTPAVDPSPPGRLLTPFNTLVVSLDPTRVCACLAGRLVGCRCGRMNACVRTCVHVCALMRACVLCVCTCACGYCTGGPDLDRPDAVCKCAVQGQRQQVSDQLFCRLPVSCNGLPHRRCVHICISFAVPISVAFPIPTPHASHHSPFPTLTSPPLLARYLPPPPPPLPPLSYSFPVSVSSLICTCTH